MEQSRIEMEIGQLKALKLEMESKLFYEISKFEHKTGVPVDDIRIERVETTPFGSDTKEFVLYAVKSKIMFDI